MKRSLLVASPEAAHVVESISHGTKGSPAFGNWGDGRCAELYIHDIYDIYVWLGMTTEARFARAVMFWFHDGLKNERQITC